MLSSIFRWSVLFAIFSGLGGCGMVVMDPSGDIARQQADLIIVSTLLMLIIIVPVIAMTAFFAWRYRARNTDAEFKPDWDHSTRLELLIWGAPLLIIIVLGLITWISTHTLEPSRPLDRLEAGSPVPEGLEPIDIEVVALDWKWLFIYPEQNVATVNQLVIPVDVPVRFKLTASTVMNSFYIPALAGQIYAMPGMANTLNAVLNETGTFDGFSAHYSGEGFSDMRFKMEGVTESGFEEWVHEAQGDSDVLTSKAYLRLEQPSIGHPVERFGRVEPGLYDAVVKRCVGEHAVCNSNLMGMH
jgi:cytochrome o ubiquinol oxidase subunit 2